MTRLILIRLAPLVGVDADDSAKGISSLNMLGAQTSPERLVEQFDAPECFRTFPSERNPSFTANCNILKALVSSPSPEVYSQQIEKVARYICSLWSHSNGPIRDKWVSFLPYLITLCAMLNLREPFYLLPYDAHGASFTASSYCLG